MAWTAPKTFVDGVPLTAEDLNVQLRDNLLETEVAKAKTRGSYFVTTDENRLEERVVGNDSVVSSANTQSTSYTDLPNSPGPEVTVKTGASAIVIIGCQLQSLGLTSAMNRMSFEVSGASQVTAVDRYSLASQSEFSIEASFSTLLTDLTPGDNTFTAKYRVSADTGNFSNRRMIVIPL